MKNILLFLCLIFGQSVALEAQNANLSKNRLAIEGYDPVAYFKSGKPVQGSKSIQTERNGAIYYFSNEANKAAFLASPTVYTPQYGGWCAYAMGETSEKVEIDPKTFKIIDTKLYLFFNAYFNNTLTSWNKKEAVLKAQADKNWAKFAK